MRRTERERENPKTLILQDSSVRSIWTYPTANPCYTTNKHKRERQKDRDGQTETDRDRDSQAGRKAARLKDRQIYRKSVLRETKNEEWFSWRSRYALTAVSFHTTRLRP